MKPLHLRTPAALHPGDIVKFDGFDHLEEVDHVIEPHDLPSIALIRTRGAHANVHPVDRERFLEVRAELIPGLGYVSPPLSLHPAFGGER